MTLHLIPSAVALPVDGRQSETAQVFTDVIDTQRSLRLEVSIVFLILFEVLIAIFQLATGR